ncbi:hypothetical protein BAU15_13610 [Enterococcus sp. JM4C]|uniref:DUF1450 domain-containing protein n=1 Tax=Candidatus Enterococcus huntleyi TaxID=1857217 RepID=UPI0013794278|nr:DUF1450 domain-containing protein [Enterococcus sp. JM4C]KAF1298311.1 hypothetical protein BAU15_13610 [Enterococcus sp. JM4C]
MDPLLEFCEQNLAQGSQLILEDTAVTSQVEILTYSCMNECTLCAQKNFAFFEGERLVADSPEALKEEILKAVKSWQEEYM